MFFLYSDEEEWSLFAYEYVSYHKFCTIKCAFRSSTIVIDNAITFLQDHANNATASDRYA